jgi:hypothetical protein
LRCQKCVFVQDSSNTEDIYLTEREQANCLPFKMLFDRS